MLYHPRRTARTTGACTPTAAAAPPAGPSPPRPAEGTYIYIYKHIYIYISTRLPTGYLRVRVFVRTLCLVCLSVCV